jgi:predicted dehydrogenase
MRAAVIGCGFIGAVHVQAVQELGHTVALVVDESLSRAEEFAKQYKVERFGDSFLMALGEDIQCVHICTPPTLHYDMIKQAINAGKHVICEKPMCLNPEEAKELALLAQKRKLVNAVNFNVRFHEVCKQAKKLIATPEFGGIHLIHGSYLQEFHVLPDVYSWRYKPELAGPMRATTEIGSHWIDLARYWTGLEVVEVSANYGKFNPDRYLSKGMMYAEEIEDAQKINIPSDDAAVISLRFSNGAIGNVLLSEVSHGRTNRLTMEVTGAKQSVWWNSEEPYYLHKSHKFNGVVTQSNAFSGGFPNTFKTFFAEVYQDIEADRPSQSPSYPTFCDGFFNAAVCAAIYESATHNSEWVKIQY